jgi:hypothetical protein
VSAIQRPSDSQPRAYAAGRAKPFLWIQTMIARARERVTYEQRDLMEACDELTDLIITKDPAYVRTVVAREIRKQLRLPEDRWPVRDRRMTAVADLRAAGLSVRKIVDQLGLSVGTVHRDLKRWGEIHPKIAKLPFQNSVPTSPEAPASTTGQHPEWNGEMEHPVAAVTPIRRTS